MLILGDLFDRGSEAVKLQDFVLELMEQDWSPVYVDDSNEKNAGLFLHASPIAK